MKLGLDEKRLTRSICKQSFYEFVREFWGVLPNDRFYDNWHIKLICDELQNLFFWFLEGEKPNHAPKYDYAPYVLVINQPPGSSKSLINSIYFQPWAWLHFPQMIVIGSSYNENLAFTLSQKARQVVKSEKYQDLFPEIQISGEQDAKGNWANTLGGERIASGQKSITGKHAHWIVDDDPLDPKEIASEAAMKEANDFWINVLSQRKKSPARTIMVLVQQRLHETDVSGMLLGLAENAKNNPTGFRIKHICLPAVLTEDVRPESWKKYYYHDDPEKNGLFDPVRFPKKVLNEKMLPGEYTYASQFLQRPVPLGGGMFKIGQIKKKTEKELGEIKLTKVVRYWDKAATAGDGCFSVGTKMGRDINGNFWILNVKRGQWDSSKRESIIEATAGEDTKDVSIGIEQEPGSSGVDSAQATVRRLAGYRVMVERPTGNKEVRADPFSTQCNAGNVYMLSDENQKERWNRPWLDELCLFPNGRNKDQVDSASGAFRMLINKPKRIGGW